jgi:hypothetical protein
MPYAVSRRAQPLGRGGGLLIATLAATTFTAAEAKPRAAAPT